MDSVNTIDYHLRDLPTRSVTLFPTRAQVRRDIANVALKPGTNHVTICGLSPTVDEDSVKIEGAVALTISDVCVEARPNRDIFEQVYPDSDTDGSDDDDDDDDDDEEDDEPRRWREHAELRDAKEKLMALQDARRLADEAVASAESRLRLLDAHGKTLDRKRGVVIQDCLQTYKEQRSVAYADYMSGLKDLRQISDRIEDQLDDVYRLQKIDDKARAKAQREKDKARRVKEKDLFTKARRREERRKEKQRIRAERQKFWPKFCYAVKITLETDDVMTPAGSPTTSVSGDTRLSKPAGSDADADAAAAAAAAAPVWCSLVLSYVTSSAYWAPSYDLQLSTVDGAGTLSFDAELHNSTSEAWSNCKIVLSTSQATFSGLDDAIPTLNPWYLGLAHGAPPFGYGQSHEQIARSHDEMSSTNAYLAKHKQTWQQKPRSDMFGVPDQVGSLAAFQSHRRMEKKAKAQAFESSIAPPLPPPPVPASSSLSSSSLMAANAQRRSSSALFGSAAASAVAPGGFGAAGTEASVDRREMPRSVSRAKKMMTMTSEKEKEMGMIDEDADDRSEPESEAADSVMEETGLTSTYELPGLKTLVPKSVATKQRVAHIRFANIAYSHTVVAKYKPVAYLKARFKNTSRMTLFKGRAGLTLDGSFMGRTTLPRCSAGEAFTLSLGVDPAIKVTYPKPIIQRATAGLFSKENTAVFTRNITLHNTRASSGKPTSLVVLDQTPLSQDEKLRIEVLIPQGVAFGAGEVRAGSPGLEGRDNKEWGTAKARLKKDGEVSWDVSLNPGKAVRLTLEYGIAFPTGTYPC
ncbi:uncharacterized protein UV8b_00223 [Ustilaginoidea virens]|uniref:Uncharacterized protein n=1 Tax=Ustilaginoidea virens TaxID=1159556 RepID=A0A063CA76_USTVR|nr:uncharacterized protein UV8b_00223 [Ustilaginoidea virens]QUC15982.1 hypothetical protein UV8b_00223 [Ustilaginoidea virens]GAO17347.1 hypothetical protein UVI_02038670 [Ustilaginoidea virens]